MEKRPKLLLINPLNPTQRLGNVIVPKVHFSLSPLGLMVVASLTPSHWDIKIRDENYETFDFEEADLVGLTGFSTNINRAYEIAAIYRKKGIKTILGGPHASVLPEEAQQYVDTVLVGEAEAVWAGILADFEKGEMKPTYHGGLVAFCGFPKPRYDLFKYPHYFDAVQTTRGCPMNCDFCSVTSINGHRYRQRPIPEVLDELATVPSDYIFFVDDNLIGNSLEHEKRALELFKGMIDRGINKRWQCFASLNVGKNDELLHYAWKSGCRLMFIGIEADDIDALTEMNKRVNMNIGVSEYTKLIRNINRHKIVVLGSVIYGLDTDTPEKLKKRHRFLLHGGINTVFLTNVTPFPGTRLFERLKKENRLLHTDFPQDWRYYDFRNVIIQPKNMTPKQLEKQTAQTFRALYSWTNILMSFLKTLWYTRDIEAAFWAFDSMKQVRPMIRPHSVQRK